jgi:hypothetical protein
MNFFFTLSEEDVLKGFKNVIILSLLIIGAVTYSQAALITFDDFTNGTSCKFDSDGDGLYDVLFSTADTEGFLNTGGPGGIMTYINEPGLEGSTLVNNPDDLRVDFLAGAKDHLSFGFALLDFEETPETMVDFKIFDNSDCLLANSSELGIFTQTSEGPSFFPEGEISLSFNGSASYATFDFNTSALGGQRYIIDNFKGIFGTTEVPEPGVLSLLGLGLLITSIALVKRRSQF